MQVDPCHHNKARTKTVEAGMAYRYGGWLRI